MVFTLTCNLLAQSSAKFGAVEHGGTYRIKNPLFSVGGKGVNVSRELNKLGVKNRAVIFCGGESGGACMDSLRGENFDFFAVETDKPTRAGLVVFDESRNLETTFLGEDIPVGDGDFSRALEGIESSAEEGDILALCGSCPGWSRAKKSALEGLLSRGRLRLVLDTYGEPLADLFPVKSEILKINADEFSGLCGVPKNSADFEKAFGEFSEKSGAKIFAVTNSSEKVLIKICGKKFEIFPPKIHSPAFETGCGDIVLARLISALSSRGECGFSDFECAINAATEAATRRGAFK